MYTIISIRSKDNYEVIETSKKYLNWRVSMRKQLKVNSLQG